MMHYLYFSFLFLLFAWTYLYLVFYFPGDASLVLLEYPSVTTLEMTEENAQQGRVHSNNDMMKNDLSINSTTSSFYSEIVHFNESFYHMLMKSNESLCPMQKKSSRYDLVLFTTDDGFTERIQNKSRLFSSLMSVYVKNYNFQPVIFTKTPELVALFHLAGACVIQDFEVNMYNLPIINNMFNIVQRRFEADYYGYVNADILLQNNIFEVLGHLKEQTKLGLIRPQHELAGRVYEKDYPEFPYLFTNLDDVNEFYKRIKPTRRTIRNPGSADYFIFSQAAMPLVTNETHQAVIGRREIDNYLLGVMWNGGKHAPVIRDLIDSTTLVIGIHIGRDGFFNRKIRQSKHNERWNFVVRGTHNIHHGYLNEPGNKRIKYTPDKTCCIITKIM